MSMDRMEGNYLTDELELAAYLKARGRKLVNAFVDGTVVRFAFEAGSAGDIEQYFEGAAIPARELFSAHRALRALIQQVKQHGSQRNGADRWQRQMAG